MKVFISSVFQGMEPNRAAAAAAVRSLGYEPLQAENFPALSASPRVACLEGVRSADAVVLLLGERYGPVQASDVSATHEEYREAKDRCPVYAFVQRGITLEEKQRAFLEEVQTWSIGHLRRDCATEEELRQEVTKALHQWGVARSAGTVDGEDLLQRAVSLLPKERRQSYGCPLLSVAVAGGPLQSILRPSELESSELHDVLLKAALFGEVPIFTKSEGNETTLDDHSLIIKQKTRSLLINEQGSISERLPVTTDQSGLGFIIEENVQDTLLKALRFAAWALSYIDPNERLSHVAIGALSRLADAPRTRGEPKQRHRAHAEWGRPGSCKPIASSPVAGSAAC